MAIVNESLLIRDSINNGRASYISGGSLNWYSGAPPATSDLAPSGVLLATNTCAIPAFSTSVAGIITYNQDTPNIQVAVGTLGYVRILTSAGLAVADLDVGLAASGAAVIVDLVDVAAGDVVNVLSFTIEQP